MQHRFSKLLPILTFAGDILALNGLFFVLSTKGHFIVQESWYLFLIIVNLSWIAIILYTNTYKVNRVYAISKLISRTIYSVGQHFLITCAAIYLMNFLLVHKWSLLAAYAIFSFIILTWRLALYYFLSFYRSKGYNFRNVVIVGFGAIAKQLEIFFSIHPEYGFRFLGYFDDNFNSSKKLGDINTAHTFFQSPENKIDEVYCCLPYVKYGQIKKLIELCEDKMIKVKIITDFRAFSFKGIDLERYDHIPVLNVSSVPLDNRKNQILKLIFDVIFSSFLILLVFSWLFPVIMLAIKATSKGPAFFKQKRTGKGNTDFICWKFRTMYVNNEADIKQATREDSRVTPVGAFLRKTSLDELPQFFNVLLGSMSVVGPRPHMLKHTVEYSKLIKKYMIRHHVKPGITGLAQRKGYRGETENVIDMKNRLRLDRFYIENWSFILDLKIITDTAISIVRGSEKAF